MAQFTYPLTSAGVLGHKNGAYPDSLSTLIEGWESGALDSKYGGATSSYSVGTTNVHDGSYAVSRASGSSWHSLTTIDGPTTSQGNTYSTWIYPTSTNNDIGFTYFTQNENDPPDGYLAKIDVGNNNYEFAYFSSGNKTVISSTSVSLSTGTWYKLEAATDTSGNHNLTLYDSTESQIASVSGTDTTYASGGYGWTSWNSTFWADTCMES